MVLTVSWSIGWASRSTSGGVPTVIAVVLFYIGIDSARSALYAVRRVILSIEFDRLGMPSRGEQGCYSAFGPVSGASVFAVSAPAGRDVEPLASLRGCPPDATSVPSWLHRVWK